MLTFLSKIEDHSIIICPLSKKQILIKEIQKMNPLLHIKFFDKKTLIQHVTFTYDVDALMYLFDHFGYKFTLGEEVLENLCKMQYAKLDFEWIEKNPKINGLMQLYRELDKEKLLDHHPYFPTLFLGKTVYVYGYSTQDVELQQVFEKYDIFPRYLQNECALECTHEVIRYDTMEEEVIHLFIQIGELVKKKVTLDHIYLYTYPSEYQWLITKYAHLHHLIIESTENHYLYDSPMYQFYVSLLQEYSFEEAFDILSNQQKQSINPDDLCKLVDVVNKVIPITKPLQEKIDLCNYLAKKTTLKQIDYAQKIRICDYTSILTEEDYVFIIGFSLGNYPKIYKDTDFYSDEEKSRLGLNTSFRMMQMEEEGIIQFIKRTKHVNLSYKEHNLKNVYYPSLLVRKLGLPIRKSEKKYNRYCLAAAKLETVKAKDLWHNYNIESEIGNSFSNEELEYRLYNHHFKPIEDYDNQKVLNLSYTSIQQYNTCPFSYFVSKVLKIGEYEESFATKLGNLFHHILEVSGKHDIVFSEFQKEIDSLFLTSKERFFANMLLPQVLDVIQLNTTFMQETKYNTLEIEKELTIQIDEKTNLVGRIDKMVIDEEKKCIAIIDYKTNDFTFKKEKCQYGVGMQLPIYAYLLKENYKSYQTTGIYIQNVCLDKKNLKQVDKYQLVGLTIRDLEQFKRFEPKIGNRYDENGKMIKKSQYVKHCALIGDGNTLSKAGFVEKEWLEELETLAKQQVNLANQNIRRGEFAISPIKFIGERNDACRYCKFGDICFVKDEDVRLISLKEKNEDEV